MAYRDADFEKDFDRLSVASFPVGLKEIYRFLPNETIPIRKANSSDDISRFYRYFNLVQKNRGKEFKWRHYLRTFHESLRKFKSPALQKPIISENRSTITEISSYASAREAVTPTVKYSFRKRCKNFTFGSPSSSPRMIVNSSPSTLNVATHVLKICNETKNLAKDIYKKVEKISSLHPKMNGSPKGIMKQKRHRVRTVGIRGESTGSPNSLYRKGESSDTEVEGCASTSDNGSGDRKRHCLRENRRR